MPSERRRIPLTLQAVFVASNRGRRVNSPPPGNVAIRMFRYIFPHSPSHRTLRRTNSIVKSELDTIIQSSITEDLHKPSSPHPLQTEHDGRQRETICASKEMETPCPAQNICVKYPSASSRSSNDTTIACTADSYEEMLYFSPVKYIPKLSINALVSNGNTLLL